MKFELNDFRSVETFARSIKMMKKIILKSLDDLIAIRLLFDRSKRAFDCKTEFSAEFPGNCSKCLKKF